jgi:hypothetical protein
MSVWHACIFPLKKTTNNNKPKGKGKAAITKAGGRAGFVRSQTTPAAFNTSVKTGFRLSHTNDGNLRMAGVEHLRVATFHYGYNVNVDGAFPINPLFWVGCRVAAMADLFCNWKLHKLVLHYIPTVATSQDGTVSVGTRWGFGLDDGTEYIMLLSSPGGMMFNVREPMSCTIPLAPMIQNGYYTAPVAGVDSIPGTVYFRADCSGTSNVTLGNWLIEYDISLFNAKLDTKYLHTNGRNTADHAFTAAQCTAIGDARPYVMDYGAAQTNESVAFTLLEDYNAGWSNWNLIKGAMYFLIDMNTVDATQWAVARRYFGIAKTIGGALLSSLDNAAPHTLTMFSDVWTSAASWLSA